MGGDCGITLEDDDSFRLVAERVARNQIAKRLGMSRATVLKAVASEAPSKYGDQRR